VTILELHRQGLSISAIATRLGMDRRSFANTSEMAHRRRVMVRVRHRPCMVDRVVRYVTERVGEFPHLSVERLLREVHAMGYTGARTALGVLVREIRPPRQRGFEVHFETLPGIRLR
jgi:hypothetical protein